MRDPIVAAHTNVALLEANAATALFGVGPIFLIMEPCACWMVGGWTYALNSGGLLGFNSELTSQKVLFQFTNTLVWFIQNGHFLIVFVVIGNVPFIIAEAFSV